MKILRNIRDASIKSRKQIWQCATPKSASTYLNNILHQLLKSEFCFGEPVPFYEDRCQEPDPASVYKCISRSRKPYFSGHIHCRYTEFFRKYFLSKQYEIGGGVIVQTRDLGDTIVSLKDDYEKNWRETGRVGRGPWFVTTDQLWPSLSDADKYLLVARTYSCWHIDFENSWERYKRVIHINYNELVTQPVETITKVCSFFQISKDTSEISSAISVINASPRSSNRLNIGTGGRGNQCLPDEVKNLINEVQKLRCKR